MPKQNNYEVKLKNFILNNAELVGVYESLEQSLPIEYCEVEIIDVCQKLLKILCRK